MPQPIDRTPPAPPREARRPRRELAEEQAALRRVATLIARRAAPATVFAAVAQEVAGVLGVPLISIVRTTRDGIATQVGAFGQQNPFAVGTSWPLDKFGASGRVWRSQAPARVDYTNVSGDIAARLVRDSGIRFAVGVPIFVDGAVWGAMMALSAGDETLPADTERRLANFTELVATAISNTQFADDLHELAREQAALKRVATLVARDAAPQEVFDAVCTETGELMNATGVNLAHFTSDGLNITMSGWSMRGSHVPTDTRLPLEGETINVIVQRTGQPARVAGYDEVEGELAELLRQLGVTYEIGAPVIVEDGIWGALIAGWDTSEAPPRGLEHRLANFAELAATAIANAKARSDRDQLAREQAALRRVATLVAHRADPGHIFAAVAEEVGRVLNADVTDLWQYDENGVTYQASWSGGEQIAFPSHASLDGASASRIVWETGRPARIDDYEAVLAAHGGPIAAHATANGIRSVIACPVTIDGALWGVMSASTLDSDPLPAGAESTMASFTELVATAISNAATHAKLVASRARIVAASDEARRRIERNLHDGTQQQLVSLALRLREIQSRLPETLSGESEDLEGAVASIETILEEVRVISQGLHPPLLARAGLIPAVRSLARRSPVPVRLQFNLDGRFTTPIEAAIYYAISEAITNAAKHSAASELTVALTSGQNGLRVRVSDDGIGGARPASGSGLIGLTDRVEALGGQIAIDSPVGRGTTISIHLPVDPQT
jgi:signal transduction histidine kinase